MASRTQKYPDTDTFRNYNANPKGRVTGDCSFRAMSTAMGINYNESLMERAQLMCKNGYALNDTKGEDAYLKLKGWVKHSQPKRIDHTKYTGKEFCQWLSEKYPHGEIGNIFAHIGGHHVVAICPVSSGAKGYCLYKVHDIWDSTYKCIGNWWTSGEVKF